MSPSEVLEVIKEGSVQFRRDKLKVGQQTDKAQEEPINMVYMLYSKLSNINNL